jgi:predicted dehydrogenase
MRLAVIGAGSAGARHARNLVELGHDVVTYDPAAVVDGIAAAKGAPDALTNADAAVVASPSALHVEHALAAIELGIPVLVEKPLATTVADAARLEAAAADSGVLVAAAMNLRFLPALELMHDLVAAGRLGRPLLATASFGYDLRKWRPQDDYRLSYSARAELGGGILLDAIHELDYLLWLFGPHVAVQASSAHLSDLELDVEDVVVAAIRFRSGVLATVDLNFFEPAYRRGCTVVGAESVATWDWGASTVTVSRGDDARVTELDGDVAATYRRELVDFLAAVSGEGAPRTSLGEARAAVELADAIRLAAESSPVSTPVSRG